MRREATRVLVTGGAGFIGSHLVRALVGAGHAVRVFDDLSRGRRERLTGMAVELMEADIRDPSAVRSALEGMEVAFHFAGVASPRGDGRSDHLRSELINVGGALNLLEAARALGTCRVVIAGSGAVYGTAAAYILHEDVVARPATIDAVQRLSVEHHARIYREQHKLPTVVLRLFRCFGPGEPWDAEDAALVPRLCHAALAGRPPVLTGDGRQTRDLVYIDDAVAGLLAAGSIGELTGGLYNVASGEAVSPLHAWRTVAELFGYRDDAPEPTFVSAPAHEPQHVRVSIARACRDLGFAPTVSFREGVRRTIEHARREAGAVDNGWFAPHSRRAGRPAGSGLANGPAWLPPAARPTPPPPLREEVTTTSPALADWWRREAPPLPRARLEELPDEGEEAADVDDLDVAEAIELDSGDLDEDTDATVAPAPAGEPGPAP